MTGILGQCRQLDLSTERVTLVFDKGNLSQANWRELDGSGLGYVASLVPCRYPRWSQRDLADFETYEIPDIGTVRCLRGQAQIAGRRRTVVVLDSPTLRAGQLRGISQQLAPVVVEFTGLAERLARAKRRRGIEAIERQIQRFVKPAMIRRIIGYQLSARPQREGYWDLDWWIDAEAYQHLRDRVFGRRILVSNRDDWTTQSLVWAYWGQSQAEHVFGHLKDRSHLALRPQFHWTDQKIQVHAFCCLVGYLLAALVRRHARQMGYRQGMDGLLDMLNAVRIVLRTERRDKPGRPRIRWPLEDNEPEAIRLYESLARSDYTLGTTPSND